MLACRPPPGSDRPGDAGRQQRRWPHLYRSDGTMIRKRPLSMRCSGTGEFATCGLRQRSKVRWRTWQPQWLLQMQDRCSGSRSWANADGLAPCLRQTSAVFGPASCSRRIPITFSSVKCDPFISAPHSGGLYSKSDECQGLRSPTKQQPDSRCEGCLHGPMPRVKSAVPRSR